MLKVYSDISTFLNENIRYFTKEIELNNTFISFVESLKNFNSGNRRLFLAAYFGQDFEGAFAAVESQRMLLAEHVSKQAMLEAVEELLKNKFFVSGVFAVNAKPFADIWCKYTGENSLLHRTEVLYSLNKLHTPLQCDGVLRKAIVADTDLLINWRKAFLKETKEIAVDIDELRWTVNGWLQAEVSYLWSVQDKPVSLLNCYNIADTHIRIGIVYTPPEFRGRGYASNAVYAVSKEAVAKGRGCILYADKKNDLSNRIYQKLGYEKTAESEDYFFMD